jgi:hypothetical protein
MGRLVVTKMFFMYLQELRSALIVAPMGALKTTFYDHNIRLDLAYRRIISDLGGSKCHTLP